MATTSAKVYRLLLQTQLVAVAILRRRQAYVVTAIERGDNK